MDMLVKLYQLPPLEPSIQAQTAHGISIRRALPPEMFKLSPWISAHFEPNYTSEAEIAMAHVPVGCFVAMQGGEYVGFACYDTTARGFFGPMGVDESMRGKGTGAALLLACLHAMYNDGYGYAIIGAVGPVEFYEKIVGATRIPDSTPGIYAGLSLWDED